MTFKLKELTDLKKEFDHAVDIILERENKKRVESLSNEKRRYQHLYLSSILNNLIKQESEKAITPKDASYVFYGAMLTVRQHIADTRGILEYKSLLDESLVDILGIEQAEAKPSLYQMSRFYAATNEFLKQIFVENNSRKGFGKKHILASVEIQSLIELIKISYLLGKQSEEAIVASLVANGQTTIALEKAPDEPNQIISSTEQKKAVFADEYKPKQKAPISATERFTSWEWLTSTLETLITKQLAHKNVSNINKLSLHRAAQLNFLITLKDAVAITTISDPEKTAILAGAMHLIRRQIYQEYASAIVRRPGNSKIYEGLNKILGKHNEIAPQDIEALIFSTTQFVCFLTIENKAIRKEHPFSSIAGFELQKLKDTLTLGINMIHECRNDALRAVVEKSEKNAKPVEKEPKSYLATALKKLSFLKDSKSGVSSDEEDILLEYKKIESSQF